MDCYPCLRKGIDGSLGRGNCMKAKHVAAVPKFRPSSLPLFERSLDPDPSGIGHQVLGESQNALDVESLDRRVVKFQFSE
jgi:hypothetical protein